MNLLNSQKRERSRNRLLRVSALLAACISIAGAVLAGPLNDAKSAYRSRDYTTAQKLAEQAIQANPNDPDPYVVLGSASAKLGDKSGAQEAWGNVLRLDPDLKSVKDKSGFLTAYRGVGGQVSQGSGNSQPSANSNGSGATGAAAGDILRALQSGNVYVAPEIRNEINADALRASAGPTTKLVVVTTVYPYRSREEMAAKLREALNLGEGVVVVGTPKGIGASSGRLSPSQITTALSNAKLNQIATSQGFVPAMVAAAQAMNGEVVTDRRQDTGRSGGILFLILGGIGALVGWKALQKRRSLKAAKDPVEKLNRQVLDNLSYVDGYLDLLPKGAEADNARALRQSAYEKYATVGALLKDSKSPDELRRAQPLAAQALSELTECRSAIDKATGGTGVAMGISEIPSLQTDAERAASFRASERLKAAEQVGSESEASRYQAEIDNIPADQRGVSFFSGRPLPTSELVPVTLTIQGQKRTVMASRDEAEAIRRGETPQVRAFEQNGQYVPWYENRNYDPYRDYYGGYGGRGALGTFVDFYVLSSLLGGGMFGGYGPWGFGGWGYGMGMPYGFGGGYSGYYGPGAVYGDGGYGGSYGNYGGGGGDFGGAADAAPVDNAGGFDFLGQQGYNDTAQQPDSGGGGFFDGFFGGGGGDSGGGDSGGDFGGGGDFGSGGDFGGGGD